MTGTEVEGQYAGGIATHCASPFYRYWSPQALAIVIQGAVFIYHKLEGKERYHPRIVVGYFHRKQERPSQGTLFLRCRENLLLGKECTTKHGTMLQPPLVPISIRHVHGSLADDVPSPTTLFKSEATEKRPRTYQ